VVVSTAVVVTIGKVVVSAAVVDVTTGKVVV
jgi:hypothetical protein